MFGFTAFGDVLIGAASFVAGVYFADVAKAPVMKIIDWAKAAIAWVKAKL